MRVVVGVGARARVRVKVRARAGVGGNGAGKVVCGAVWRVVCTEISGLAVPRARWVLGDDSYPEGGERALQCRSHMLHPLS